MQARPPAKAGARSRPGRSWASAFAGVALILSSMPSQAHADGFIDNVNGLTIGQDGRVIRFRALLIDSEGRVTRLVPPGEPPPQLSRKELKKNAGKPLYDYRTDMGGRGATRSVEQGAASVLWGVTATETGGVFRDGRRIPF